MEPIRQQPWFGAAVSWTDLALFDESASETDEPVVATKSDPETEVPESTISLDP